MASDVKTVLVLLGDRSRPVTFKPTDDVVGDNQLLKQEIKDKFDDVLSPEDDVFLKLKDSTWDGMFVDLQDQTVENHDVLKAVPVQSVAKNAVSLCDKVTRPSQQHRSVLSKLFPTSTASSSNSKPGKSFDPGAPLVTLNQKLKKKSTSTRSKPYKRWVIVMEAAPKRVPSAGARRKLLSAGREKKVEFCRNLSKLQVKNTIVRSFPDLKLQNPTFWKCDGSCRLTCVDLDGYPDGEELLKVGSKESVYLVEGDMCESGDGEASNSSEDFVPPQPKRVKVAESLANLDRMIAELRKPLNVSSDDESSEPVEQEETPAVHVEQEGTKTSEQAASSEKSNEEHDVIDLDKEEVFGDCDDHEVQSTLVQRREIISLQDREYQESLRLDREKAQQVSEKVKHDEDVEYLQHQLREKFSVKRDHGIRVSLRTSMGTKVTHMFDNSATTKDLYEFAFVYGEAGTKPFKIYHVTPRSEVVCGSQLSLAECEGIDSSLLVIEESSDGFDPTILLDEEPHQVLKPQSEEPSPWFEVLESERLERQQYTSTFSLGVQHEITRKNLFDETLQLFGSESTLCESTLSISFTDEIAVDVGGVTRDLLSAFWEEAYGRFFDGSSLVRPVLHPHVTPELWSILGAALSHGYLVSGFLPVRLTFPSLLAILKGPQVQVPSDFLRSSFVDYVSIVESNLLTEAMNAQESYSADLKSRLMSLLFRYDYRRQPTPSNILCLIDQVARYEFITKPMAALVQMHQGIPARERGFWQNKSILSLSALYTATLSSPEKVLEMIEEPFFESRSQERVFGYLQRFIGNMTLDLAQKFLRFVTGSSVTVCPKITIQFNSVSGLARCPVAHTCAPMLELPVSYDTYVDFANEFQGILSQQHDSSAWMMTGI